MTDTQIAQTVSLQFDLHPRLTRDDVREVRSDLGERWQWGIRRYGDEYAASLESAILQAVDE